MGNQYNNHTECKRGHPWIAKNIYITPGSGQRRCIPCVRLLKNKPRTEEQLDRQNIARAKRRRPMSSLETIEHLNRDKARHPDRHKARRILHSAVRWGKVAKPNRCSDCGDTFPVNKIHGHHHDYSLPLDVLWLCRPCHNTLHRVANRKLRLERIANLKASQEGKK